MMKTTSRMEGDVMVISLHGKIISSQDTADMHGEIRTAVEANTKKVILDLGGLEWTNSTGLGAIVAASSRLRNADSILKLARPNEAVSGLLAMNKLNLVFEIHPSVEAAVASFR